MRTELFDTATGLLLGFLPGDDISAEEKVRAAEVILWNHADILRARARIDRDDAARRYLRRPDPQEILDARNPVARTISAIVEALLGKKAAPTATEIHDSACAACVDDARRVGVSDHRGKMIGWVEAADQAALAALDTARDRQVADVDAYMTTLTHEWRVA